MVNKLAKTKCNACSSLHLEIIFELKNHRIALCINCFTYNNFDFAQENPADTFDQEYYESIQSEAFNVDKIGYDDPSYDIYQFGLSQLEKLSQGKNLRILDVGAGYGSFVQTANLSQHQAVGIEISKYSSSIARSKNIEVYNTVIEDFEESNFDVITLWDVIEHVANIDSLLAHVKSKLSQNGLLLITTDNYDSLIVDIAKTLYYIFNWKWPLSRYLIPENTVYFEPASIKSILEKNGFEIVDFEWIDYPINKINLNFINRFIVSRLYKLGIKFKRESQFFLIAKVI